MLELVTYIVTELVDDKSAVNITSAENDGVETITIRVAEKDIGKVIGKQGKIAMSAPWQRPLVSAKASVTISRLKTN